MFGPEPSRESTHKYVVKQHRGQKCVDGRPYYLHSVAVAKRAEQFGRRHYSLLGGIIMPLDQIVVQDMWHAGMLHDTMTASNTTFDEILALTNPHTAQLVSQLSCDNRLPRPRRVMEYANRLFHADVATRLIKLADLCCDLQDAVRLLADEAEKARELYIDWPSEVLTYLSDGLRELGVANFAPEYKWCEITAVHMSHILGQWPRRTEILRQVNEFPGAIAKRCTAPQRAINTHEPATTKRRSPRRRT